MGSPNSLAITSVIIFDGHDFRSNDGGFVVIRDGIIREVGDGPLPANLVPPGTPVLDKPGHTLMPGLIDAHIHAHAGDETALEQSLRFGVTTVMDLSLEHDCVRKLQGLARDPRNAGKYADYKTCGFGATIRGGWPGAVISAFDSSEEVVGPNGLLAQWPDVRTVEDAEAHVEDQVKVGAEYIKMFHESGRTMSGFLPETPLPRPSLVVQKALVGAAHRRGLKVIAHATSYQDTMEVLECGVDGLAHGFTDSSGPFDRLIDAYRRNDAHCDPTLATMGSVTGEGLELQKRFASEPLAKQQIMSESAMSSTHKCMCFTKDRPQQTVENTYAATRALHDAGIPIILGSDSAAPAVGTAYGLSAHQEIWLLAHKVGMSPSDVLRSGTSLVAERFGYQDRGVVEPGRKADLALLEGDAHSLWSGEGLCLPIQGVWRDGVAADTWPV